MHTFSRWMPTQPKLSPVWSYGAGIALATLAAWLLIRTYPFGPAFAVLALLLLSFFERQRAVQYRRLVAERAGEGLCTFVRAFGRYERDPHILRAVYEELESYRRIGAVAVPLRPSDQLDTDLGIDGEELEFIAEWVAHRAGRSLTEAKANPFYGRLRTAADLVQFFRHQPRIAA
jgi:hypothetical protein